MATDPLKVATSGEALKALMLLKVDVLNERFEGEVKTIVDFVDFFSTTDEDNQQAVVDFLSHYKFEPFNIRILIQTVMLRAIGRNIGTDINKFIAWDLTRGPKMGPKQLGRMNQDHLADVKILISTYHVIDGKPNGSTDLNVSRIIACFPHYRMIILHSMIMKEGGIPQGVRILAPDVAIASGLHPALLFSAAAELIPEDPLWTPMFQSLVQYFDAVSKILAGKGTASETLPFANNARKNDFFKEKFRIDVMNKIGITGPQYKFDWKKLKQYV